MTRNAYKNDKKKCWQRWQKPFSILRYAKKVNLLLRLPGFKLYLFTKRLVVVNQSFAPLDKKKDHKKKSLGVLWHEGLSGRNEEEVTNAFIAALKTPHFRDYEEVTIWLDNCAGQNKRWTLYTALVHFVNSNGRNKFTLKYFKVGHRIMSADNFHRMVEKELRDMKKVCDWKKFVSCVSKQVWWKRWNWKISNCMNMG